MMIAILKLPQLFVTDRPSYHTISHAESLVAVDEKIYPIVVVRWRGERFLVLDGHNRACALAKRKASIIALIMHRKSDRDVLLRLEEKKLIPEFPHRNFLMGGVTLKELRSEAIYHAAKNGFITLSDINNEMEA